MIVKVCGIKTEDNLSALSNIPIDMIGLNFYPSSARYVGPEVVPLRYDILPDELSRVGVFVNESLDEIMDIADEYRLDYLQLHGDEQLDFCVEASTQLPVIKVVRVGKSIDWHQLKGYEGVAEYILFDTNSKAYGGSGHKFDWSLLADYPLEIPYMIGGGVGPTDVQLIKAHKHHQFVGVDINSKFESAPAVKNTELVTQFVLGLKT